jgi:hypothetical protein
MARPTSASECYLSSEHDLVVNEHYDERVNALFSPTSDSWIDVHYLRQKHVPSRTSSVQPVDVNHVEESGDVVWKEKLRKQTQVTDVSSVSPPNIAVFETMIRTGYYC